MSNIITNNKLDYLETVKADIKSAIIEKGQPVSDVDTFKSYADKIRAIRGGGSGSATVYFVTFIGANGAELYKMPVLAGDDCKDPIAHGDISTPTKESTVQYNYTYSGWSLTDGGEADDNALKAVTEDRTVYAAFTESLVYYTINFYDGDTLLKTEQIAYGGSSNYTYSKDNYILKGWLPEPTNITGDMDCYAQFEESYTFADASWEYIADISARGLASTVFALGDTKDVEVVDVAGRTHTLQFHIVGFNHDDLADGTGKAGISIVSKAAFYMHSNHAKGYTSGFWSLEYLNCFIQGVGWEAHAYRTAVQTAFMGGLPEALRSAIKEVTKKYDKHGDSTIYSCVDTAWIPSATELLGNNTNYARNNVGTQYEYYEDVNNRKKTLLYADGKSVDTVSNSIYGTRQACTYSTSTFTIGIKCNTGLNAATSSNPNSREIYFCPIGFCI